MQKFWAFLFLYGEASCEIYENLHQSKISRYIYGWPGRTTLYAVVSDADCVGMVGPITAEQWIL